MNNLTIFEDRGKLKRSAPLMIILGILAAGAGFFAFLFIGGAIGGAIGGGLAGGGGVSAYAGFKRLGLMGKEARVVLAADEAGVKVARDAYQSADSFFPWSDIYIAKAVNKNFALVLIYPDKYIDSLTDKNLKKAARLHMRSYGTPIFVQTTTCAESAEDIAEAVNQMLETHRPPV
jgi:hypothetical protein